MKISTLLTAAAAALFTFSAAVVAQEKGQWRALSTTARGITGDIGFTDTRIIINFNAYTIAQIRSLTSDEMAALFPGKPAPDAVGSLFRTEIPGEKRFLHKNTLCGTDEVQWIATYVAGRDLQIAMFSGSAMPKLTADAVANTTSLCGTYSYVR